MLARDLVVGGFDRATDAAPEVELPGGVEPGVEEVEGALAAESRCFAEPDVAVPAPRRDDREELELRLESQRARLVQRRQRDLDVAVVGDCALDHGLQPVVAEALPPGGFDVARGEQRRLAAREGRRHVGLGRREIRADRAGGGEERDREARAPHADRLPTRLRTTE